MMMMEMILFISLLSLHYSLLLLRLLTMLKKERHSSAQHSPTAERAKLIQNSVRRVSFLSAFVVVVLATRF